MTYPNQFSQPYPYTYQPQVQPPMDRLAQLQAQQYQIPQQMQQPPQANQGLLWVQGEAAARSYLIAPNNTVLLMDSDTNRFYIKSANGAGMPSLQIFEYSEVPQNQPQAPQSAQTNLDDKYVTREEYSRLQAQYADIVDKLNSFHVPSVPAGNGKQPAAATTKPRGKGGNANE